MKKTMIFLLGCMSLTQYAMELDKSAFCALTAIKGSCKASGAIVTGMLTAGWTVGSAAFMWEHLSTIKLESSVEHAGHQISAAAGWALVGCIGTLGLACATKKLCASAYKDYASIREHCTQKESPE